MPEGGGGGRGQNALIKIAMKQYLGRLMTLDTWGGGAERFMYDSRNWKHDRQTHWLTELLVRLFLQLKNSIKSNSHLYICQYHEKAIQQKCFQTFYGYWATSSCWQLILKSKLWMLDRICVFSFTFSCISRWKVRF